MWRPCRSLVEAVARGPGKIPPLAVGCGRFANGSMHNRWAFTNATNDNALSVMVRQVELLSDNINQLHSEKTAEIKQLHSEKNAEIKQLYSEKEQLHSEKEQLYSEKNAEIKQLHSEKTAQIKQLQSEKNAEIKQLYSEKEQLQSEKAAEIKQLYSDKEQLHSEKALKDTEILKLSLTIESVRSAKRVALIRAGRVDLRGILEHLLKEEGTGTSEAQIVAFVESHDVLAERCRQEPKITSDVSAVTTVVLARKLHQIWRRLCSDVHPRLTPEQWQLRSGEDCIQLRSNGESDSDVLLLYHLFDHFGYPVQSDVVLRQR